MDLEKALRDISTIHEQLERTEVYRGYRAKPTFLVGVIALVAAALQPALMSPGPTVGYVVYWCAVAVASFLIGVSETVAEWFTPSAHNARRRIRTVLGQLIPPLSAGAALAVVLPMIDREYIRLLPGLWAILMSMAFYASRPYLTRHIDWPAGYFLAVGVFLVTASGSDWIMSPWVMGGVFGTGQFLEAVILYLYVEKNNDH